MTQSFIVHSNEEKWKISAQLARVLKSGLVLALEGDLGAGKTTFMQGVGGALGVQRLVTSPTFTLLAEYQTTSFKLVHMDLYRLNSPDDLLAIGFLEYLETGAVVAIEWPERAGDLLPPETLYICFRLTAEPSTRVIELAGAGL